MEKKFEEICKCLREPQSKIIITEVRGEDAGKILEIMSSSSPSRLSCLPTYMGCFEGES
ncbi:hypothetical protein D3C71_1965200 [compost metagenome]